MARTARIRWFVIAVAVALGGSTAVAQQNARDDKGSNEEDSNQEAQKRRSENEQSDDQEGSSENQEGSDQDATRDSSSERREQGRQQQATAERATGSDDYPEVDGLQIQKLVLAKKLEKGKPVDPGTRFRKQDGRIFAAIELKNRSGEATKIHVSWHKASKKGWRGMALEVPARYVHRTTAFTWATPREPGKYECTVRTAEGKKLGEKSFRITR